MRKKKNLWSGVSILIVAVLVITAFIRGNAQAWLLAAAFVIWAVWATCYFLVPYIKEEFHRREAKRIRRKCEKQDAAFDRFIIPEVSDPVEQVLLRHANYRISAYLQSVYPNATWEWREEFPERIIAKGGTGRVKLFGVDGYNFADVTFDQNGGINCALVNIVPLKQPNAPHPSVSDTEDTAEAPAAMPKQPDPVDPQVWYEVQGRKVLEALITDLHSRGYNSLTIRENGDIAIQQADSEKVRTAFESVPEKPYWARLCKVFEREGMAANITDGGFRLSCLFRIQPRKGVNEHESGIDDRRIGNRGHASERCQSRLHRKHFHACNGALRYGACSACAG